MSIVVENEYRVIGPPGCIAGECAVEINRIGVGACGITRKMTLGHFVERFNSAVPGGMFRGGGYAGTPMTLWDSLVKTRIRCVKDGMILLAPVVRAINSGVQEVHQLILENGSTVLATSDHEFLTPEGLVKLSDLRCNDLVLVDAGTTQKTPKKKACYLSIEGLKYHPFCRRVEARRYAVLRHRLVVEAAMNGVDLMKFVDAHRSGFSTDQNWKYLQPTQIVHHKDENTRNNELDNLEVVENATEHGRLHCKQGRWKDVIAKAGYCRVSEVKMRYGARPTYDLTVYLNDGESGNYLVNGIAVSNCGKTTYLSSQVKARVDRWCSDTGEKASSCTDVLVSSLTKAAANEVLSRGLELPDEQIGTLHAHALHALGNPKLCVGPKQIGQWNKESRMDYWLGGGATERNEDGFEIGVGKYRGDSLNAEYTINRCRLLPREQWSQEVIEFAKEYERWKYRNDYCDYADLIHRAFERRVPPPGNPSTILVDECQDHDAAELRLLRFWATCVNKLIIVGDPDQCQPGDTRVDVSGGGSVRLDELDESVHRLVSYDRHSAKLVGLRNGMWFKKAKRSYTGRMTSVALDNGKATQCTHDHRWLAKWKEKKKDAYIVYVMHKGDRWRVGWCKLWSQCGLHFSQRCRLESADAGWILKTFDSSRSAAVYEKIVAVKYGLPLICFNPRKGHEYVDEVFQALDPGNQALKATLCLSDHGRDYHHPFWDKKLHCEKQGSRTPLIVRACNLLPEYMQIPDRVTSDKSEVSWHDFEMAFKFVRDAEVFSLDVETHHNYVANGIVTMNNLYEWRGSDPGGFYESQIPPGQTKVLEQSYRVPKMVHAEAMQMIARSENRQPVVYHPRDEKGEVDHVCYSMRQHPMEVVRHIEELLEEPDSSQGRPKVMCLFSCAYMSSPLISAMRSAGVPFWNPYSKERGNFNPLHPSKGVSTLQRMLAFLRPNPECYGDQSKIWNWSEFNSWVELCSAEGWLRHGAKAAIKRRAAETPTQQMSLEDIDGVLSSPAVLEELQDCDLSFLGKYISDQKAGAYEFAVDIARRRGYNSLMSNPRVVIGTIHSVKGAEADHVILCPDLSSQGWDTFGSSRHRDAIHRLFYVGLTRAYRRLVLTAPSTPQAVQW